MPADALTLLLALAPAIPGRMLPPGASGVDALFAYGSVVLLVGLIWWGSRSAGGPPQG